MDNGVYRLYTVSTLLIFVVNIKITLDLQPYSNRLKKNIFKIKKDDLMPTPKIKKIYRLYTND